MMHLNFNIYFMMTLLYYLAVLIINVQVNILQYFIKFSLTRLLITSKAFWNEFEWIRMENKNTGIVVTNLKTTRYNKTAYSISGSFEFTADFQDDYDVFKLISISYFQDKICFLNLRSVS